MCSSLSFVALLAVGTAGTLGGADLIAVTDGLNSTQAHKSAFGSSHG